MERSDEPGGLSRSIKQDGFVFDHTGHLLHLHNPYTQNLIPKLLGDNIVENQRRAWIFSHHTFTRYPFQANTYGLPRKVIEECLAGLAEAQLGEKGLPRRRRSDKLSDGRDTIALNFSDTKYDKTHERRKIESFKHWVLRTFGKGFAKHFFFPYNEKLWTV